MVVERARLDGDKLILPTSPAIRAPSHSEQR